MKAFNKVYLLFILITAEVFFACSDQKSPSQKEVQDYLESYNIKYRELYTASSEGQWLVNTHIVENDTMNAYQSGLGDEALAKFTGSNENITKAKDFLKDL